MIQAPLTRRTVLRTLVGTAVSLPLLRAADTAPAPTAAQLESMEAAVRKVMKTYQVPGLSLALAHGGTLAYSAAFGMADKDAEEPLTPAFRFRIASVSKPITSAAIFRLIELGKLGLDDKVFGPKGRLPDFEATDPKVQQITLHHLLTHTSGGWGNAANDPMFKHVGMSHRQLIAETLKSQPLNKEPGQSYAYSNFGYCLLGRVIEAVTGETYEDHVKKHILAPCGIETMCIGGTTVAERLPQEVIYHGQRGEDPYRPTINPHRMDSHGGWIATATDLTKLLVRLDGFPNPTDLLTPASIRLMTSASSINPGYACGWAVNRQPNWWHGGSLPGTATLAVRTASGMCWSVLTNTRGSHPSEPSKSLDLALDRMMWELARSVPAWRA
jgi:CubicO group peptidase (beta-lactamase class C family)